MEECKTRKRLFAVLVTVGLLVAGLPVPAAYADLRGEITGLRWQRAELTETEPASQPVKPDLEYHILVLNADGSANLTADGNQARWTYTMEDSSLTFDRVGPSTLAFCGEHLLDQISLRKVGAGAPQATRTDVWSSISPRTPSASCLTTGAWQRRRQRPCQRRAGHWWQLPERSKH